MTDELTRGLCDLGEEVIVITPIYQNKVNVVVGMNYVNLTLFSSNLVN